MSRVTPICPTCGAEKVTYGSRLRCRPCATEFERARRAKLSDETREAERVRNNLKRNELRARWTPEKREAANAQVQAWREVNRERHRAGARDWYARNAEYARAKKLAEYYANPEPFVARNFLRKARLLEAVCEHGDECVTSAFLAELYAAPCVYCGDPATEADHFYPLAKGGLHCRDNLVPACLACNRSKHASDPHEWVASKT